MNDENRNVNLLDQNQFTGNTILPFLQNEGIKRRLLAAGQYRTADLIDTYDKGSLTESQLDGPIQGDAGLLKGFKTKVRKIHSTNFEDIIYNKDTYPLKINLPDQKIMENRNQGLTNQRNLPKI